MMQTAFFPQSTPQNGHASGSGSFAAQPKRKRQSWTQEDHQYEQQNMASKQARVRSPGLDRRTTFPLMHSASNGHLAAPGGGDMDMDGDGDVGMDAEVHMGMGMSHYNGHSDGQGGGAEEMAAFAPMQRDPAHTHSHTFGQEHGFQQGPGHMQHEIAVPQPQYQRDAQAHSYNYSFESGSGGFGFGPGAAEDDGSDEEMYNPTPMYPSYTNHPNPHHFSNMPTTVRPKSPLSAQPFSTSLRAPGLGFGGVLGSFGSSGGADLANTAPHLLNPNLAQPAASPHVGIIQPATAEPLFYGANEVERARAQHGPQCTSIPKLVLSEYPDPATGTKSMWAMCRDCGAVERSS